MPFFEQIPSMEPERFRLVAGMVQQKAFICVCREIL